jgi:hypothetical protein
MLTPDISTYPKLLPLRDGEEVAIRPMTPGDEGRLLDFFLRLPEAGGKPVSNTVRTAGGRERRKPRQVQNFLDGCGE